MPDNPGKKGRQGPCRDGHNRPRKPLYSREYRGFESHPLPFSAFHVFTNPRDRDVEPTAFDPFDHRLEDQRNIRLGIGPKAWPEKPRGRTEARDVGRVFELLRQADVVIDGENWVLSESI